MHRCFTAPPAARAAAGAALLEALFALLLVSLLSAALLDQQGVLRDTRTAARQRIDALQLARREFDRLRSPAASSPAATTPSPFELSHSEQSEVPETSETPALRDLSVVVNWRHPAGGLHRVQLDARVPRVSPVYDAVLGLAPQDIAIARPLGRAPDIPFESISTTPDRSLWQPGGPGAAGWVFGDADGAIVARCNAAPSGCEAASGTLLSGHLRFSASAPPDPATPGDPLLPLGVVVALDGPPARTVRCTIQPVATAGARFVRYSCVVPDPPAAGWSGRVEIEPLGWSVGTRAGSQRVCRYSADLDASGAIDRNDEHPARYTAVHGALRQQNYLVVRGDQPCPDGSAIATHNDALLDTVQHQP
jgi:hypothetical protein